MRLHKINIKKKEGIKFSLFSGDNNAIHINEEAGNKSIYGENIVHGVLVILKLLEIIKLKKNSSYVKILFREGFKYNSNIKIKKKKINKLKTLYYLIQQNNINAEVEIGVYPLNYQAKELKKVSRKKKYLSLKKKRPKISFKYTSKNLIEALTSLSKYVGTVYPGKNSLISEINIAITQKKISRNILITSDSSLETKGYPVIENKLVYKNFKIDFKSLIRPELKIKLNKPKKRILREVQSLKKNIIIVGASSGIGNDLLNLFINNKKVKIIATYFKNKILIKKPNLIIKKINIENDLLYILKIIKKYSPCLIYYFPTPKILFKIVKDKKIIKSYKNYFIKWPIQIIKHSSKYNCGFFYPSTTYSNNLSIYSLVKSKAEKEINKLRSNKVKISIAKIPGINTKQNLSLINKKLPTFRELISRDDKIFKQVFFK